jgi:hypothetical protein
MKQLTEYTREDLEPKTVSELEWHYMEAFKEAIVNARVDSDSRLRMITNILFLRNDHREKRTIHAQINIRLEEALRQRNFDESVIYRNMLAHYEQHIMG